MIFIPLLIGAAVGGLVSTIVYAKVRNAKDRKRKTSTKPTPEKPYKIQQHVLIDVNGISWTPKEFKMHIKDLAQSMANLDELSFIQVDFQWRAKNANSNAKSSKDTSIVNLKTMLTLIDDWTNVASVKSVKIALLEIMEPKLDHPHVLTELDKKIITEIQETEDYRLRVARMRAKQAQRNI